MNWIAGISEFVLCGDNGSSNGAIRASAPIILSLNHPLTPLTVANIFNRQNKNEMNAELKIGNAFQCYSVKQNIKSTLATMI